MIETTPETRVIPRHQLPETTIPDISIPDFTYDYENETTGDFVDIMELNTKIQALRHALYVVSDKYSETAAYYERVKLIYDRAVRREFLSTDGRTDGVRRDIAAITCENLENDMVTQLAKMKRLKTEADTIRADLNLAIALSYNLRHMTK